MIAKIDRSHFDGSSKVLMSCTTPTLRKFIERRADELSPDVPAHACVTLGSRDHRYLSSRTAVVMRAAHVYRDASFFIEIDRDNDCIQVGVRLVPLDDIEHSDSLSKYDSDHLRSAILQPSWRPLGSWEQTRCLCRWTFLCDSDEFADIPDELRLPLTWAATKDFRIVCIANRVDFLELSPNEAGAFVANAIRQTLEAVLAARRGGPA